MQTGEDIHGIRKIMDFTRFGSMLLLAIHFYSSCYQGFAEWHLTSLLSDRILANLLKIGLFKTTLAVKSSSLLLLAVSLIGVRGRKDDKIQVKALLSYIVLGLVLYANAGLILYTGLTAQTMTITYIGVTIAGYLLILSGGAQLSRLIKLNLFKDIFNKANETFPQQEELLENDYSINLPARYTLKNKIRSSWINIINPFRGLLVIGTPGAGKSYFIIRHIITQHIKKGFTMFLYDFKFDDLTRIAYNTLLKHHHGYQVKPQFYVINFDDLNRTHRCNPLEPQSMEDLTDATEASRAIMLGLNREWIRKQGDFFVESPINFVTAIIWFLRKYKDGKYCTLPHVIELMQAEYAVLFPLLKTEPEVEVLINPFVSAFDNEAMEQLEGQVASAKIGLARLASPKIYYVLSGNDFTLDINNPAEPKIVCVGNNPQKLQTYGAVLSLFFAKALKLVNRKHQLPCSIIADEFPTIYFNNPETVIATGRSNRLATTFAVQDNSQLKKDYGREQAEVIMNIPGNVICGQANGDTAKQLSERFGKIMQQRESVSINSQDTSVSRSTQLEASIPPSAISALSSGEFVGMVADDPNQKITLKVFHAEIVNDHEAIAKEEAAYQPLPEIQKVSAAMVRENYERIKLEVQEIIQDHLATVQEEIKNSMVDFEVLIPAAADQKVRKHLFQILYKIKETDGLTLKESLLAFDLEKETAVKDLKLLKDAGLLKFSGANKTGKYKLTDKGGAYVTAKQDLTNP
ncbi:conjugal transfer protein MobC [Mucilaginibacter paludis]|uniref:TRAG family protein n=1 Tax=Mucilaginibacter paludis DSM 18603 TaxID=714943 RepID=H1XZ23_9SPHI|nr:conjugal transfer protein MobC [Mucilaginibacter paludis]EHQ24608.1 TRAG family protein [Mucilaginibacter paludis DSM 18603]